MLARRVFHDNRAARLAFTRQQQAIEADFELSRCRWSRGVTRRHGARQGHVARLVGQGNVQAFAIFLCRAEGRGKRAIRPDDTGADLRTGGVFHDDRAARFTFTCERQTIRAHSQGVRSRRRRGVARRHSTRQGHVARLVGEGDVKGLAIFLRC